MKRLIPTILISGALLGACNFAQGEPAPVETFPETTAEEITAVTEATTTMVPFNEILPEETLTAIDYRPDTPENLALEKYELLISKFKNIQDCEFYSGAYFENGTLFILVTDLEKSSEFTKITGTENVEVRECRFSYPYLTRLNDRIGELFSEKSYKLNSGGISQKNNRVGATVSDEEGKKLLKEKLISEGFSAEAFEISLGEAPMPCIETEATTTMVPYNIILPEMPEAKTGTTAPPETFTVTTHENFEQDIPKILEKISFNTNKNLYRTDENVVTYFSTDNDITAMHDSSYLFCRLEILHGNQWVEIPNRNITNPPETTPEMGAYFEAEPSFSHESYCSDRNGTACVHEHNAWHNLFGRLNPGIYRLRLPVKVHINDKTDVVLEKVSNEFRIYKPEDTAEDLALETVRAELDGMRAEAYAIDIEPPVLAIDSAETERIAELWTGSELAESRGWNGIDLRENLFAVKAQYYAEFDHGKTFLDDGFLEQYFYVIRKNGVWEIADRTSPESASLEDLQAGVKLSADKTSYSVGEDISTTLSNASSFGFIHGDYSFIKFERFENGKWAEVPENPVNYGIMVQTVCNDCPMNEENGEPRGAVSKEYGDCRHTFTAKSFKARYGTLPSGKYRLKIRGYFSCYRYEQFWYSNEFTIAGKPLQ